MNPLMLCVHMSRERMLRLSFAAMAQGVRVKAVPPEQEGQRLAALCGLEEPAAHPLRDPAGEEMLVFAFLEDAQLDRLLNALREGMEPVRLKAVLTPFNKEWSCGRLYRQLREEAEAMKK